MHSTSTFRGKKNNVYVRIFFPAEITTSQPADSILNIHTDEYKIKLKIKNKINTTQITNYIQIT